MMKAAQKVAKSNGRRQRTRRLYKQKLPSGQISWLVYEGRDASGKQHWKRFPDKVEAETHLEQLDIAKNNEGLQLWSLTPDQRQAAAKCYKLLEPHKAGLLDAARYYLEHALKFRDSPPIEDVVRQLVGRMERNGRRPRAVKDARTRLERFTKDFKGGRLNDVTLDELRRWLDGLRLSGRSVAHYMTKISQLSNFAMRNSWCSDNLIKRLDRPSVEEGEVQVFQSDEARRLLQEAAQYGLLPYVAIGLFAGLRSAELQRLDWAAVKMDDRTIIVGPKVAKKRGQRVVEISDGLAAWLAPCLRASGPVTPPGYRLRPRLHKLIEKAHVAWKPNGLRHSFCSYHLALHGDPVRTAYQAGNSADMVHRHYKALVSKGEAERFWGLRPGSTTPQGAVPTAKPD